MRSGMTRYCQQRDKKEEISASLYIYQRQQKLWGVRREYLGESEREKSGVHCAHFYL